MRSSGVQCTAVLLFKKSNNTGFARGVAEAPRARGEARRALGQLCLTCSADGSGRGRRSTPAAGERLGPSGTRVPIFVPVPFGSHLRLKCHSTSCKMSPYGPYVTGRTRGQARGLRTGDSHGGCPPRRTPREGWRRGQQKRGERATEACAVWCCGVGPARASRADCPCKGSGSFERG